MSEQIMACIDGSRFAELVCHYACWAGQELSAPLTFLHVLDRERQAVDGSDHSGNIGLGAREQLLSHLSSLDEQRAKVAREQGKLMLAAAVDLARADGIETVNSLQRHGELVETLSELEQDVRLMVVGKRGEDAHAASASGHLGSNLERVLRAVHRPVLIATGDAFKAPKEIMFAFDNSASTRKGIQKLAGSPLFQQCRVHVVTVGVDSEAARKGLPWVEQVLNAAGISNTGAVREGDDIESVLTRYAEENAIDMTVMGAYGHSRIRHLLVGSTTTTMIQRTKIPLLVLR